MVWHCSRVSSVLDVAAVSAVGGLGCVVRHDVSIAVEQLLELCGPGGGVPVRGMAGCDGARAGHPGVVLSAVSRWFGADGIVGFDPVDRAVRDHLANSLLPPFGSPEGAEPYR